MTELTFQKCDIWPLRGWFHQMELNRVFSPCWGQVKHYSHHSSLHKNISPSLAAVTSLVNLAITRQAASCWYRAWDNSEKGGWREGKGRESGGGGQRVERKMGMSTSHSWSDRSERMESPCLAVCSCWRRVKLCNMQASCSKRHTHQIKISRDVHTFSAQKTLLREPCKQHNTVLVLPLDSRHLHVFPC